MIFFIYDFYIYHKYIKLLNMIDIKEIMSFNNEPLVIGFLSFNKNYENKIIDWNDDGKRYKFFDFTDKEVKLKNKEKFRIFSNETNSWKYFKYYLEKIDKNNKLISPEYIKPIEKRFTYERIISFIAIIISIIALINK